MYQFSRAIYRELAPHINAPRSNHEHVLHACEAAIERLATDRYYFAKPERSLFGDIRGYFPIGSQERVYQVVSGYMGLAQQYMAENPAAGYASISGKPMMCRATTRKGAACQRVPLPHNGYCPSHQHLADTEDRELAAA